MSAAPWKAYAAGSDVADFKRFCAEFLIQSVDEWDGEPLELHPFQTRMFGEAMAYDEHGDPIWRSVVLVLPRKNGKTCLLAAYAVFRLVTSDGSPEILLAASSDKQAGRLYEAAATFIRRNETLASMCRVRDYIGEIAREDGEGKLMRLSSDPARLHGYNPSLVICDELAQWSTPSLRRAYAALTTAGGARKAPQTFTITTAGEAAERAEGILGRLIDRNEAEGDAVKTPGLTVSRNMPARTLVYNYSAPTANPRDVAAMKKANPAPWITKAFLARQAANPELSAAEVLQLHGCVWSSAVERWVDPAEWNRLAEPGLAPEPGVELFFGADGALTGDCSALAWAWKAEDDRIGVACHVWSARQDVFAHEYADGRIDNRLMVPFLLSMADEYLVRELAYDPRYLETVAQMLSDEGIIVSDAWSAGANRAKAWQAFVDAKNAGTLVHDGDQVLAGHVTAAKAKQTELGWKVEKLQQHRKIDALVAMAMAHWRCQTAVTAEVWAGAW